MTTRLVNLLNRYYERVAGSNSFSLYIFPFNLSFFFTVLITFVFPHTKENRRFYLAAVKHGCFGYHSGCSSCQFLCVTNQAT